MCLLFSLSKTLSDYVKKFGKVYSISMGGIPCVVVADHAVIKKYFAKEEFCGSAPLGLFRDIMRVRFRPPEEKLEAEKLA